MIRKLYAKFRAASPFMLVGENAKQALDAARIYAKFKELERQDRVRLIVEREQDIDDSFFDTCSHLSERSKAEAKARYRANCWRVSTEYLDERGTWQLSDCIGNCDGTYQQQNAFENPCMIDLMRSAVEVIHDIDSEHTDSIMSQCRESAYAAKACASTAEFN